MEEPLRIRVLVAIEPRSYREAIGGAIQALRPHLDVILLEPEMLGPQVSRLNPELVICSQPDPFASEVGPAWVEYRPYDKRAKVRLGGARYEIDNPELMELVSIVDETERLIRNNAPPNNLC